MTTATETTTTEWEIAGAAWSHAAADWAYLFEPHARDAVEHLFSATGVGPGTDLFDMACGSGFALARAERLGATTTGLDASAGLLEIAARRCERTRLDAGSMFELPYEDESFDVVTSFNGIWGGCETAVQEAYRVLRPGGWLAITFWGPGRSLDLRDMFMAIGGATPETGEEMIVTSSIGAPGVAEQYYTDAGFTVVERGETQAVVELASDDIAWRCVRSPGLLLPVLETLGEDATRDLIMPTLAPFRHPDGSYRITNALTHVIGRKL